MSKSNEELYDGIRTSIKKANPQDEKELLSALNNAPKDGQRDKLLDWFEAEDISKCYEDIRKLKSDPKKEDSQGWIRDLTRECVEPNPGPSMDAILKSSAEELGVGVDYFTQFKDAVLSKAEHGQKLFVEKHVNAIASDEEWMKKLFGADFTTVQEKIFQFSKHKETGTSSNPSQVVINIEELNRLREEMNRLREEAGEGMLNSSNSSGSHVTSTEDLNMETQPETQTEKKPTIWDTHKKLAITLSVVAIGVSIAGVLIGKLVKN